MDPLTLFALANGAVSAVKAGCKLYKDIKGAAGDVTDVLKDLDNQWEKLHPPNKPPSIEQKNHFIKTRNEVVINNKKANAGEHTGLYTEIGNHLGTYFDNYYKCKFIFEEEERKSKTEVYTGDDSLGKRALQRVLMKKQLEQMGTELREIMVYQSPAELGALWTEVNDMMEVMGKQQKSLIIKQFEQQQIIKRRQAQRRQQQLYRLFFGIGILVIIFGAMGIFMVVAHMRTQMYPQYGLEFLPSTEEERRQQSQPQIYVGR